MNKFYAIGNLTRNPEMKTVNDKTICNFTIAVTRSFSGNGEKQTDFFNCSVWGKLAENCGKYLEKGKKVAIIGSVQMRKYTGKDGTEKTATEIVCNEVEFLSKATETEEKEKPTLSEETEEGLPF